MKKLPAIALIEFGSVAAGAFAADKMVKRAQVELLHAGTVQPGKFLILIGGGTAEVEESHRAGVEAAAADILDEVLLPDVHPQVVKALDGSRSFDGYESLVVLETSTVAAVLRATDAAAKGARVEVAELRLGNGLGGRGLAILTGDLTDVEAAADIATRTLAGRNVTLCHSIVSNVHEQFAARLGESTRFFNSQPNPKA
jgi:bacterial microcompartment shell protein